MIDASTLDAAVAAVPAKPKIMPAGVRRWVPAAVPEDDGSPVSEAFVADLAANLNSEAVSIPIDGGTAGSVAHETASQSAAGWAHRAAVVDGQLFLEAEVLPEVAAAIDAGTLAYSSIDADYMADEDGEYVSGSAHLITHALTNTPRNRGIAPMQAVQRYAAVGDRVYVSPDRAHMPEASGMGTVAEVGSAALGVVFDVKPGVVHRWVTVEETSASPPEQRRTVHSYTRARLASEESMAKKKTETEATPPAAPAVTETVQAAEPTPPEDKPAEAKAAEDAPPAMTLDEAMAKIAELEAKIAAMEMAAEAAAVEASAETAEQKRESAAVAAVERAIGEGRITAHARDKWIATARADLATFQATVSRRPAMARPVTARAESSGGIVTSTVQTYSEDEIHLAAMLRSGGLTEEKIKATIAQRRGRVV